MKPAHHGGSAYRPDIDGLRAVAVLSVILYHAGVGGFSGGFVGVDVFFVISGYLISSIVFRQIQRGTFSIAHFYERRIRRIAPALTVVLVASTLAALVLLLPTDLWRFSKSLVSTLLFGSNVHFWRSAGYFDPVAATKPLLHTWSLAIEEQFYLFFPATAIVLARYWPRHQARSYLLLLLASLAACIVATRASPDGAFYLLPTRAWELLVGVMLACTSVPAITSTLARNLLAAAGLAAIVCSVSLYGPLTPFPGAAALLPTLGTVLVMAVNRPNDTRVGSVLSWAPVVLIGRMSYSLYLWHWPVLVFFRYATDRGPAPIELAGLLLLVFALSAASWRFVEEPFRRSDGGIPYHRVLGSWLAPSAALLLLGVFGWVSDGYRFLQRDDVNRYLAAERDVNPDRDRCFTDGVTMMDERRPCLMGPQSDDIDFIVWGDSHADALMPLLVALANEQRVTGIFAAASGCVPLLGVRRIDRRDDCPRFADSVAALVRRRAVPNVILTGYWSVYTEGWEFSPAPPQPMLTGTAPGDTGASSAVFDRALQRTVTELTALGARIWIVEQVPSQARDVPAWLASVARRGGDPSVLGRSLDEHRTRQQAISAAFDKVVDGRDVHRLEPAAVLCREEHCSASADGRSLYADQNHLSTFGALKLEGLFRMVFVGLREPESAPTVRVP